MARSIFDPLDIPGSLKRLSAARGTSFSHIYRYLTNPDQIQLIPSENRKPYALRNLRSDLSTWRSALSQVPADQLLSISWFSLLIRSRPDLVHQPDTYIIATLLENIRLFTTQLKPDGLYIGSYTSFGGYLNPTGLTGNIESAFTAAPTTDPQNHEPLLEAPKELSDYERQEIEYDLDQLNRRRDKLSLRAHSTYTPDKKAAAELLEVEAEIKSKMEQLKS